MGLGKARRALPTVGMGRPLRAPPTAFVRLLLCFL